MSSRRLPRPLHIELPDGQVLDVDSHPVSEGQPVRIVPLGRIESRFFDVCPICRQQATEDEHVPPASIGGVVMTRTCGPCNNRLGSHVEADLADWHDGVLTLPRFSADVTPGQRRSSRIAYRITGDGKFVLVINGSVDPAVRTMLESGRVDLIAYLPDPNRSRLGLLKHAFLAACLEFGMLEGSGADAVRSDLIAARDAADRYAVPRSEVALGLTVGRSKGEMLFDWPVIRAVAEGEDGPCEGVVLGGTTFVSWSSRLDDAAYEDEPVRLSLAVGRRVDGTIV